MTLAAQMLRAMLRRGTVPRHGGDGGLLARPELDSLRCAPQTVIGIWLLSMA